MRAIIGGSYETYLRYYPLKLWNQWADSPRRTVHASDHGQARDFEALLVGRLCFGESETAHQEREESHLTSRYLQSWPTHRFGSL